jgi:Arc/MetJ-type ribon-helix-helix transcriptional regulator
VETAALGFEDSYSLATSSSIKGMKVSLSLPDQDIQFLDEFARTVGARSRSAVIQRAVRLLRASEFGTAYAQVWKEWEVGGDAEVWESATGDGLEQALADSQGRLSEMTFKAAAARKAERLEP